ncbi:MAG: discoidin domain-containing protein [Phycisphaerae bacterium]|nr:discoidin domain-containing protein [Phycisphaerae bacterium]
MSKVTLHTIRTRWILLPVTVFLCAGCEMEGFNPNGERAAPGIISNQKEWTIVAHGGSFQNIRSAIDGLQSTAAVSGRNYANAAVTIDLGRSNYFNCISLLQGDNEDGYPRQVALSTSLDGKTFTHQRTVYGTRKVTYILLVQPIRARYIRLTAVRQNVNPWSLAEIFLQ